MSVLIKGIELPENCSDCAVRYEMFCPLRHRFIADEGRRKDCPLVPVPTPHGRLIDADAFENFIRKDWDKNDHWIADVVYSRPTIIPADSAEGGET